VGAMLTPRRHRSSEEAQASYAMDLKLLVPQIDEVQTEECERQEDTA